MPDLTTCVICGNVLTHAPRLGGWIAHPTCEESVRVRVDEADIRGQGIGEQVERARIHEVVDVEWRAFCASITAPLGVDPDASAKLRAADVLRSRIHQAIEAGHAG